MAEIITHETVTFETKQTAGGKQLAIATLTREKSLNSLTLETIDLLLAQLLAWQEDEQVACLALRSASDRAFCAGADIQALYKAIKAGDAERSRYAEAFFHHEYRLDYLIHQCPKPILAWGQGVVMGGGLGLLSGCSHRVATPQARVAMPEITIGLFPDAGGSWFLSRMRSHLGYFLGLTGCQLGAGDAYDLGLVNFILNQEDEQAVLQGLVELAFTGDTSKDRELLSNHLNGFALPPGSQPSNLGKYEAGLAALLAKALSADDFFEVFHAGIQASPFTGEWMEAAVQTYLGGSAVTARIFVEQMRRAKGMSMADMFRMELAVAYQCLRHPDFPEGVRALLIDKDRQPRWSHAHPSEVPDDLVQQHFQPTWPGEHPLAQLA